MLSSLSSLDPVTAAGVVARAAFAVDEESNPAAKLQLPHEMEIRRALLSEIRKKLGIAESDHSEESVERLSDALDEEIDELVQPPDDGVALSSLSASGKLPSDLYNVVVDTAVAKCYGRHFGTERERIEITVHEADEEQHYGEPVRPGDPFLISLFAKRFPNEQPYRSFTLLVAGQRNGLLLNVCQAWRIYDDIVPAQDGEELVGLLRRFSDKFGAELKVNGRTGHFFLSEKLEGNVETSIEVVKRIGDGQELTFTCFFQNDPISGGSRASLVVGVDVSKYRKFVESRGW